MHKTQPGSEAGFSLLEWLLVLAIVAMLARMAATPLHRWLHQFQGQQQAQALVQDLWVARQTAARFGQRAVLCGMDPLTFNCSTKGQWSHGRLLFVDQNNNGLMDQHEAIIKQTVNTNSTWTLRAGTTQLGQRISYAPTGSAKSISGSFVSGHYLFCPPPSSQYKGVRVVINSLGRPRMREADSNDC